MNLQPESEKNCDLVVVYSVRATHKDVESLAQDIAVEQTVEVTASLWQVPGVAGRTVGVVEAISPTLRPNRFLIRIRYPASTVGFEIPQLLSVIFGNISLKRGIRVEKVLPGPGLVRNLRGPRFGVPGIRDLLGEKNLPLTATALKPLGRSISELAEYAYAFAKGGVHIVKDDHGLTNQALCPFEARVQACAEAISRAQRETGTRTLYFPCVTGPGDELLSRALFAKAAGAQGLLLSPLLTGLDSMRLIRDKVGLPIMAHPALAGAFFFSRGHGISPGVILGTLMRLCGADLVIFPSWGGRFPFTKQMCQEINRALKEETNGLLPALPVPAGGMSFSRVRETISIHGKDVVVLVGSALYEKSSDLAANAAFLRSLVREAAAVENEKS